jgi:hypothetical protein
MESTRQYKKQPAAPLGYYVFIHQQGREGAGCIEKK